MSASTTYANQLLALIFNNTGDPVNIAAAGSATTLYVALHTASPGAGGNQSTSEAAYPGYARVAVTRTTGNWTVASGSVSNAAAITFPTATGGSETETYFSVGTAASGTGQILVFGSLTSSLAVASGTQPQFAIGALTASVS